MPESLPSDQPASAQVQTFSTSRILPRVVAAFLLVGAGCLLWLVLRSQTAHRDRAIITGWAGALVLLALWLFYKSMRPAWVIKLEGGKLFYRDLASKWITEVELAAIDTARIEQREEHGGGKGGIGWNEYLVLKTSRETFVLPIYPLELSQSKVMKAILSACTLSRDEQRLRRPPVPSAVVSAGAEAGGSPAPVGFDRVNIPLTIAESRLPPALSAVVGTVFLWGMLVADGPRVLQIVSFGTVLLAVGWAVYCSVRPRWVLRFSEGKLLHCDRTPIPECVTELELASITGVGIGGYNGRQLVVETKVKEYALRLPFMRSKRTRTLGIVLAAVRQAQPRSGAADDRRDLG